MSDNKQLRYYDEADIKKIANSCRLIGGEEVQLTVAEMGDYLEEVYNANNPNSSYESEGTYSFSTNDSSVAIGDYSFASGINTISGGKGFKVLSRTGEIGGSGSYTLDSIVGLEIRDQYSIRLQNNYDYRGIIDSIQTETNTIIVTNYIDEEVDSDREVILWIPEKPTIGTTKLGQGSHTEGYETRALCYGSHAEGCNTEAGGRYSHAEGNSTKAGYSAHAEGVDTKALSVYSHAEGNGTTSSGNQSHAEGQNTTASGRSSHAEGYSTTASNHASHAEGYSTTASGYQSHAEGYDTTASGEQSHAEGNGTTASGNQSHAEGHDTTAEGNNSHAEGYDTTAEGFASHTEGKETIAIGYASHAEGCGTIAKVNYCHVQGKYNIEDTEGKYAHIIGNGKKEDILDSYGNVKTQNRSNAHTVDWNGNAWFKGSVKSNGEDYAEYFEWQDGNPDKEDRVGLLVTLDGEKIKLATSEDEIFGIISGTVAVLGGTYECEWNGKYLTDDFGRVIYDLVEEFVDVEHIEFKEVEKEVIDEETKETRIEIELEEVKTTEKKSLGFWKHPRINPDYDPEQKYINRTDRPEWDTVGMLGKLHVRDDGTCQVNGYATVGDNGIATKSDEKTNIRVLSRVNENVIRVLLK